MTTDKIAIELGEYDYNLTFTNKWNFAIKLPIKRWYAVKQKNETKGLRNSNITSELKVVRILTTTLVFFIYLFFIWMGYLASI